MGLWEQLLATPADLSATRVWADALSEKGDPQGEFIQLSCALDELPIEDPKRRELTHKIRRLETRHGRAWLHSVWGAHEPGHSRVPGFFRGLPFRAQIDPRQLIKQKLLDHHPIAALEVHWLDQEQAKAVAQMPRLKNVVDLSFGNSLVEPLLSSPHLGQLDRLLFPQLSPDQIPFIAGSPKLDALTRLDLTGCLLTDADAAMLAQSPHLQRVTHLELTGNNLTPKGLTALLDGKWKLASLSLRRAPLGPKGIEALVAHPAATHLRALDLRECDIGVAGAEAIGAAKSLRKLHTLRLALVKGKPKALDGWQAFLADFALDGLRVLDISHSPLRIAGAKALAKTEVLSKLESLNVAGCFLGDDGVAELAKAKNFSSLVELDLSGNSMKDDGVPALAKGPLLATVEDLRIAHNKFGSDGGKALGESKKVGALRVLTLGHNWLGVLGLRAMLGNPAVKALEEIHNGLNNYAAEMLTSYVKSKTLELLTIHAPEAKKADLLALTKLPRAASLMQLHVASPDFDDEVAEAFVASPHLKELGALDVISENLTTKGKALLEQHYGPRAHLVVVTRPPLIPMG